MKTEPQPDFPLSELLDRIEPALEIKRKAARGDEPSEIDRTIADAVLQCDWLSWGHKDGDANLELIPQLAWEIGDFDHRARKMTYRHPDSPLPEEFTDIWFSAAELEPWLKELGRSFDWSAIANHSHMG